MKIEWTVPAATRLYDTTSQCVTPLLDVTSDTLNPVGQKTLLAGKRRRVLFFRNSAHRDFNRLSFRRFVAMRCGGDGDPFQC